MAKSTSASRATPKDILAELRRHFRKDPGTQQVVETRFDQYDRPNLQIAIDKLVGTKPKLFGIISPQDHLAPRLSKLCSAATASLFSVGPVELVNVPSGHSTTLSCVKRGLYLFRYAGKPMALSLHEELYHPKPGANVEVMATDRVHAERFVNELNKETRFGKVFRNKTLSLECDEYSRLKVAFHRVPKIARDDIILPREIFRRVERHTVDFARHAGRLRQAGRHIKRGILLFGPPGTGKTLLATHLVSRMTDRTSILLTGDGLVAIETACRLARLLEPSTVVLEDVDLIGTRREEQTVGANALLFELLNQMDGLAEDVDVLFILTTNQPRMLEPALASRPGRIDQAIEIPLPDPECRKKLFELYSKGLG